MAALTASARRRLRSTQFALPGRRYPIEDRPHARAALARASANASPAERARVRAAVHARYPKMKLHYHGVHPCRGGAEHGRLAASGEGAHERAAGEAWGLEGGRYGLASGFVRMAEDD